ncbi:flavin reductase family protein [Nocardioides sp. SYSU D00038]|uniref:flavin reductase family protein n=1 Tax=Nocardioides sp. SYSU D00038 TaxID=2812554 RepID=UPI0019673129|nr:flavin reductase family protein [Nocardioides sp. SYSU D00038]
MTIHSGHPFAADPDPVRRFRGRLGGAVTLWTTGEGTTRAGLTISSVMVANGEPPHVLALVDPDSDLRDGLEEHGGCVVQVLSWAHRDLAEMFAGTAPAPGGAFAHAGWEQTRWGPRLADATAWVGAVPVETREVGWSLLVTARLEEPTVLDETAPALGHRRGHFVPLGG